jgi:hypothetical protein
MSRPGARFLPHRFALYFTRKKLPWKEKSRPFLTEQPAAHSPFAAALLQVIAARLKLSLATIKNLKNAQAQMDRLFWLQITRAVLKDMQIFPGTNLSLQAAYNTAQKNVPPNGAISLFDSLYNRGTRCPHAWRSAAPASKNEKSETVSASCLSALL